MEYKFEIKKSDIKNRHWLIVKKEDKTEGFAFEAKELNALQIAINNYLNKLEQ
jgi:hypothetical protein